MGDMARKTNMFFSPSLLLRLYTSLPYIVDAYAIMIPKILLTVACFD